MLPLMIFPSESAIKSFKIQNFSITVSINPLISQYQINVLNVHISLVDLLSTSRQLPYAPALLAIDTSRALRYDFLRTKSARAS